MHPNPYQSLVSLLSNILEAYTTAFFVIDPKLRQLSMAASQSLSKFLPERVTLPLEQSGILSQVQKVGQTIHLDKLPDISASLASTVPFYREGESHIKGLFAVPVGDGAGVLYVDTKYGWGFNDKQQKWIREIADVLHELLLRQQQAVQRHNYSRIFELWTRLDDVAFKGHALEDYSRLVVEECGRLVGAEYGFLSLRDPASANYRLYSCTPNVPRSLISTHYVVKQGLIGRIFQTGKPLLITRLNPQASEHFLFTPAESLPHHGTLWGLPAETSLGHVLAMAFLSRQAMELNQEFEQAVSHALHFFQLLLEQLCYKEECDHLRAYDLATALHNPFSFEARLDEMLGAAMQGSTPFTLAVVQYEPWQVLYTKAAPKLIRQWQRDLAGAVCGILPAGVSVGQMAENRYGIIFPETTVQEAELHLARMEDIGRQIIRTRGKGAKLHAYVATVGFPQDGTHGDELWSLAHQRLFAGFHARTEPAGT